jgi:prepilin-type N-terminal cleavage/methylation domain-containing protein
MNRPGTLPGIRGQRGFTLIELMVALLVSSLLVGMILAIFSRMSLAYRSQQQIAGVQQILAAARAAIELDAKQAGLGMPQGFKAAINPNNPLNPTQVQSPVQVTNASNAPDQVALFYADTSAQALLAPTQTVPVTWTSPVTFDDVSSFKAGDLVVLTTASTAANPLLPPPPPGTSLPDIATYDACVLKIATVTLAPAQVTFDTAAPWGTPTEDHCTTPSTMPIPGRTMMYAFVAHAYRIDPTGALQRGETGGLLGNNEQWTTLALGFSDLQTAVRIYDPGATDLDNDTDARRNWYSSAAQDAKTRAAVPPSDTALLGMSISLVAHTDRNVEGVATSATPDLIGPPAPAAINAANNSIGDRPSTALPVVPPDPLLPGQRIYRWTTFQVDFRNLGVGVAQ